MNAAISAHRIDTPGLEARAGRQSRFSLTLVSLYVRAYMCSYVCVCMCGAGRHPREYKRSKVQIKSHAHLMHVLTYRSRSNESSEKSRTEYTFLVLLPLVSTVGLLS